MHLSRPTAALGPALGTGGRGFAVMPEGLHHLHGHKAVLPTLPGSRGFGSVYLGLGPEKRDGTRAPETSLPPPTRSLALRSQQE